MKLIRHFAGAAVLATVMGGCAPARPAGTRHVAPQRAFTAAVPGPASMELTTALADLPAMWVVRAQLAGLYDGKTAFVRNRTRGTTGASTQANSHPIVVTLGNRSGSHGADADRDGISDSAEMAIGSDPNNADSDGDTIPDGFEVFGTGTLPNAADSDGDGMADNVELALDDPATYSDTDGDALLDGQERALFGTNPATGDSDSDGMGDDAEYFFGTAMNDAMHPTTDADGDGAPDEFEMANGTSPSSADSHMADTDGDSVPNWLDRDALVGARVRGRAAAVPAGPDPDPVCGCRRTTNL